ncbi:MAG: translesion DNA synthesis-associated protein ImuA [Burkholderiales bacterium]
MRAALEWAGDDDEAPVPAPLTPVKLQLQPGDELPRHVAAAIWRGDELGSPITSVISSGFDTLDAELPGNGWPCRSLTEVLQAQPSVAEWRLLAPALQHTVHLGQDVVVVGPPKSPHLPGLRHMGLDERRLVWIQSEAPAERLWVTEQLIKANAGGALVAWLPQARQEQIRRLQVCAQHWDGVIFLCRPAAAEHEPSAAPLRVQLRFGLDWELHVHVLKRRGPTHEGVVTLRSVPGGLDAILTPRLQQPSLIIAQRQTREERQDVVGSPAPRRPALRRVAAH